MNKMIAKRLVSLMLIGSPAMAVAADMNEPFDFNYSVDGRNNRPVTVFNDGDTTYIQGKNKQQLFFNGVAVSMRGPYYIIKGVPETVEGSAGGDAFRIVWQGAKKTAINNESERQNADLKQKTFSGTFGRISFINGVPPDVGLVNALPKNLQLREAMKALAPHGWSGSSDRSINTTQTVNVQSEIGESWITVMDRLMTSLNIWIEIDSSRSNLYLRDAPPKGFSVVLDGGAQLRQPIAATSGDRLAPHANVTESAATEQNPVLASVNVRLIEQIKSIVALTMIDGRKRMRFINLENGMQVEAKTVDGRMYHLPVMSQFRVQTDSGESVDFKRTFKRVALFTPKNFLGLTGVTENDAGTSFTFAKEMPQMQFIDNDGTKSVAGTWYRNTFTTTAKSVEWKVITPQSAVSIEMEDKGIFLWRTTPHGLVASATSN